MKKYEELIGKTTDEARVILELEGKTLRVTKRNGNACVVTHDLRIDRLNVYTKGSELPTHSGS